jgi:hypothetical protein
MPTSRSIKRQLGGFVTLQNCEQLFVFFGAVRSIGRGGANKVINPVPAPAVTRPGRAGSQGTGFLDGRFNASSTIPVHGAGPWVIVETPPDITPDDAGDPSRVVFLAVRRPADRHDENDGQTASFRHFRGAI